MKLIMFINMLLFCSINSFAQQKFIPTEKYTADAQRAYGFYEAKKYLQSALSYDSLFKSSKGEGLRSDTYNAACSWALAGNSEKAFLYLTKAVIIQKWTNLSHISTDADLVALHTDKRWQPLLDTVAKNKTIAEAKLNKPLVALLDTIFKEDQGDRTPIDSIQKKFGWKSKQMDSLMHTMAYHDSINLIQIKRIIDTYGWLGPDEVGQNGASTLFLVIQHADSLTQVNYLPLMRQAVKAGKAQPQTLALLEDRVLTKQGKKQIYGSQLRTNEITGKYEFYPITDELNVNKRRAAVGLEPLESYAKRFDVIYVLPKK